MGKRCFTPFLLRMLMSLALLMNLVSCPCTCLLRVPCSSTKPFEKGSSYKSFSANLFMVNDLAFVRQYKGPIFINDHYLLIPRVAT